MEVLQRTANRGSISTGPYEVDNSIKLEHDNNEWLYRDAPTAGNRKTFTISLWLKRAVLGHTPAGTDEYLAGQGSNARFHFAGDTLRFMFESGSTELESSRKYRDPSAWYHIVLAVDTTQGTAANRVKLYVNGEQQSWSNTDYPTLNAESDWMNTNDLYIGTKWASNSAGEGANDLGGYLAEVVLLDGTAASPTSFGEFDSDSGIWIPIDVSGLTFGSQGFYLNFATAGDLGDDKSGNGNDLTENNLAAADQATDTPTNNFCTLNPLHNYYNEVSRFTVSEGGTKATGNQSGTLWRGIPSTFAASNGKWYFEVEMGSTTSIMVGTGSADTGQTEWAELTSIAAPSTKAKMMYSYNGGIYGYNSSTDDWQYGGGFNVSGAIESVAVDLDNGFMYFREDGAAWIGSGDPTSGSSGTGAIALPWYDSESTVFIVTVPNNAANAQVNFGGYTVATPSSAASDANGYGTFEYAPPTGYYALCTKNLAEYG